MLHYHLAILLFIDIIEATDRHDLLLPLAEAITDTEAAVLNTLVFGLHTEFVLGMNPTSTAESTNSRTNESVAKVSLISIDPYPHHVVAAVRLLRKAIDRDYYQNKISSDAYESLRSTLKSTIDHLPQSSKSVQAAGAVASDKLVNGAL